jgi:hypothetical protein
MKTMGFIDQSELQKLCRMIYFEKNIPKIVIFSKKQANSIIYNLL